MYVVYIINVHYNATCVRTRVGACVGCLIVERLAEYGWKPHRAFVGQTKTIAGLNSLVYIWKREGYSFVEFEISNGTTRTVFRPPLT